MTIQDAISFAQEAGWLGILVFIVWSGKKRWWVFGWYADEIIRDRDEWKEAAKAGTYLARTAVTTAESVMTAAEHRGKVLRQRGSSG